MMTHDDRGEGGVKNCQNGGDVICGWPLMNISQIVLDSLLHALPVLPTTITRNYYLM